MPLSEAEYSGNFQEQYNCSCQDTAIFANFARFTILMPKTNCPAKPPCFPGLQSGLDLSQPEGVHALSGTGRYTVLQEPWMLTWKTYNSCLSRSTLWFPAASVLPEPCFWVFWHSRIPCQSWKEGMAFRDGEDQLKFFDSQVTTHALHTSSFLSRSHIVFLKNAKL